LAAAVGRARSLSRFGVPAAAALRARLSELSQGVTRPAPNPTVRVPSVPMLLHCNSSGSKSTPSAELLHSAMGFTAQDSCKSLQSVGLGSVHHHKVRYPNNGSYGLIYPVASTGDNALGSTHNHKPSPLPTITLLNSSDFKGGVEAKFCHYMYSGEYNVVSGSHGDRAYSVNCTHRNSTSDDVESR